jgi:hypothetical protein
LARNIFTISGFLKNIKTIKRGLAINKNCVMASIEEK